VVECLNATGAKGVSAVHEDARDTLTHVVAEAAELANVEAARGVVQGEDLGRLLLRGGLHF
jgi:hypothetical protein